MALNSTNKEALSFKKLFGKAHTKNTFAAAEESISSNIQIASSSIFANSIDPLPETNGGLVSLGDTDTIVEKIRFEIDIIPDTLIGTNQSQGYRLKLPSGYSGILSATYSGGTYLHEALGKLQIVPSLYGELSNGLTEYDPVLYKSDGTTVISKFDPINWNLDTYNGLLFVQDPPSGYDISADRPTYLEAFLYVGEYLNQDSGERIEKTINQTAHGFVVGDILTVTGGTYIKALAVSSYPEALGIVTNVGSVNMFTITYVGFTSSLSSMTDFNGDSLSGDTLYYVSDSVAGKLTPIKPVSLDDVIKPILYVTNVASEGNIFQYFGDIVVSGGTGGSLSIVNSGGGAEVGVGVASDVIELRTIVGTGGTVVNQVGDNIVISGGSTLSANNGLTLSGGTILLGGNLTQQTVIDANNYNLTIDSGNITTGTTLLRADIGTSLNEPLIRFKNQSSNNVSSGFVDINIGTCNINPTSGAWGNIAIGQNNLTSLTATGDFSGGRNVALGFSVGSSLTTGNNNVFAGRNVAKSTTNTAYSLAMGFGALENSTIKTNSSIFLGLYAGRNLTTITGSSASYNTVIGPLSLSTATTFGRANTIIGYNNGNSTTAVINAGNTLIGNRVGIAGKLVSYNIGVGSSSLNCARVTSFNTAIGSQAGGNAIGSCNNMIGFRAGLSMGGENNIALGNCSAMSANANPAEGSGSAGTSLTGSRNTFIGFRSRWSTSTPAINDTVVIGNCFDAKLSNMVYLVSKQNLELIANSNLTSSGKTSMTASGLYYEKDYSVTGSTNARWIPDLGFLTGNTTLLAESNNSEIIFNNNNTLSGNTSFTFSGATLSLTHGIGGRNLGYSHGISSVILAGDATTGTRATGAHSVAIGRYAYSSGCMSFAHGYFTNASGDNSFAVVGGDAQGYASISMGNGSKATQNGAFGLKGRACGVNSIAIGDGALTYGANSVAISTESTVAQAFADHSIAMGCSVVAHSEGSIVIGNGLAIANNKELRACGLRSIVISNNDAGQTAFAGADAACSAIFGGRNHNIESGNINATIVGGNGINLTGSSYANHTVVGNLGIFNTPISGTTSDKLLVRDSTNGIIKILSTSEIGGGGGGTNNVYPITGVTSTTLTTNEYTVIVNTSTALQTITLPSAPVTGQAYKIKDNGNALTNNITIDGNGNNIDDSTSATINTNYGALELVFDGTQWFSLSFIN